MPIDQNSPAYKLAGQFIFPLCLYREERGIGADSHMARLGIAHVLLNRAKNPHGPYAKDTDVLTNIMQRSQFSSFNAGDPNAHVLPNPSDVLDWTAWVDAVTIAANPGTQDPTNGADSYHSYPDDRPDIWPAWAIDSNFKIKLGPVRFYRLY